ncbi:hypothetical protein ACKFKG_29785 [Phormidesmis sp. 146-35]
MTELDFVLLTVYLLCVTYVLYQIVDSFNDEFHIALNDDELKQHLAAHNLSEILGVSFKFDSHYEFHTLKQLAISINNKSQDHPIYIDWDYCSMTDLDGRSRRVTRLPPGTTLDLSQTQVFSVIAPGRTLKEAIVAEDMLTRKGDDGAMDIAKTIINLEKPDPKKSTEAQRKRYKNFMEMKEPVKFSLYLTMRLTGPNTISPTGDRTQVICTFTLTKLDWTAGLPWNPRKK